MKTKSIFNLFFMSLFVMALSFTSCGSDDDGGGGSPTPPDGNEPDVATSITLSTSATNITINNSVSFFVVDNLGRNVSSSATFTVDGESATSPYLFNTTGGVFSVVASYEGLISNTVDITVAAPSATTDTSTFNASGALTSFTKKLLLEDYTGTWCQYCPGAAAAIISAKNSSSNVYGVGYHVSYSANQGIDPMQIPESLYFAQVYEVTSFPTVFYDGPAKPDWNYPNLSQINAELAENPDLGLAVEANLVGGKLDLEVQVGYAAAINEEIKLMIYLVEDNVTTSTPQSGSSQGANYVHRDVLREVYTDRLGDVIETSNIGVGGVFTRTMTGLDLPSNINNQGQLKVIAFVRKNITGNRYEIMNVREVPIGSSVAFD